MAYKKHVWQTGEIITADKLNNIQDCLEEVNGEVEVSGSIVAFRARHCIIDLTGFGEVGEDGITVPGLHATVGNLLKKNIIPVIKFSTDMQLYWDTVTVQDPETTTFYTAGNWPLTSADVFGTESDGGDA